VKTMAAVHPYRERSKLVNLKRIVEDLLEGDR